ncbi:hypothetical protein [Spirillospora sp. NPDC047279]|uniref:hypothetical protein n=1 Tax=Spirillospora sp. NPDC047279 TaxID=3155478 RepID=UPI00340B3350
MDAFTHPNLHARIINDLLQATLRAHIAIVDLWTGRHAAALCTALRLTNEGFAEHLGTAVRTVAKWKARPDTVLTMELQQALDTSLAHACRDAQIRFALLLGKLTFGQLAVALYAADIPETGPHTLPADEVITLAAQGLERLGYERVRELDARTRKINRHYLRELDSSSPTRIQAITDEWKAVSAQLWPDEQRMQRCTDLAFINRQSGSAVVS